MLCKTSKLVSVFVDLHKIDNDNMSTVNGKQVPNDLGNILAYWKDSYFKNCRFYSQDHETVEKQHLYYIAI